MKTTVDIPENELKDAMRYAKAKTKRQAIVTALVDYNRRKRMAELVGYSAASDTFMSNEALEALDINASSAKTALRNHGRRK